MIEAFEIGVSLALQDGVLESISKAQRDVAGLQLAVQASGVSVQSLRQAAAHAVSPLNADRPAVAVEKPAKRVLPDAAGAFERGPAVVQPGAAMPAVVVPAGAPPALDAAAPVVPQGAPVAAPAGEAGFGPEGAPDRALARRDEAATPAAPVLRLVPAGYVQAPVAALEPVPQADTGALRAAPVAPVQGGYEVASRPAARMTEQTVVAQFNPPSGSGAFADYVHRSGASPSEVVAEGGGSGRASDFWQASPSVVQDWSSAMLPVSPQPEHSALAGQEGLAAAARPWSGLASPVMACALKQGGGGPGQPAAPPAQRQEAAPPSGDVFLDGMLVGRWMSRFLNQEAGRASAGPTAFDPRRGRLLPGVTVGG